MRASRLTAAAAAIALVAVAACSSSSSTPVNTSASAGAPLKRGTATIALPPGVTYSYIFPFYSIANASVYNDEQFQFLMYRPLCMFGNNTNTSVSINYPLSPADPPVYSNGGKTVTVTLKDWKWSNGETVDANDVLFTLDGSGIVNDSSAAPIFIINAGPIAGEMIFDNTASAGNATIELPANNTAPPSRIGRRPSRSESMPNGSCPLPSTNR